MPPSSIEEQTMNTIDTFKPVRGLVAAAVLCAISAGFATVAAAADYTDVRSVTVQYGDLNLSNPQGAAALYSRIVGAAHEVCDPSSSDLASRASARKCVNKAIAHAVSRVGHPELIAIYIEKTHRALPTTVAAVR